MVNYNGNVVPEDKAGFMPMYRTVLYGDSVSETLIATNGSIVFWEEHYFSLMAAMRILRMEIPMEFTPEYLEQEVAKLISNTTKSLVTISVYRTGGETIIPKTKSVDFLIRTSSVATMTYSLNDASFEVELFKDFYVNTDMLSTLNSGTKIINVIAGIYAEENGYDDCLLLNGKKQVVGTTKGVLFLVKGKEVKTAPLEDGALNGVFRTKIKEIVHQMEELVWIESSISPFELQHADELFFSNVELGIQSISKYRKKTYTNAVAQQVLGALNKMINAV